MSAVVAKADAKSPAKGRNVKREVRELAGLYAPEAVKALVNIMRNRRVSHATRIAAASALLDRAVGKPAMPPAIEDEDGEAIPMYRDADMSDLDRARRIAFLLRAGLTALRAAPVETAPLPRDPSQSEEQSPQ